VPTVLSRLYKRIPLGIYTSHMPEPSWHLGLTLGYDLGYKHTYGPKLMTSLLGGRRGHDKAARCGSPSPKMARTEE
jgi:hypothetical protein